MLRTTSSCLLEALFTSMQLMFNPLKVQGTSFSKWLSLVFPPVIPYHMSIPCSAVSFFQIIEEYILILITHFWLPTALV